MAILSEQTIVGQVGNVYDLRDTKGGNKVIDFSVAVTPRKKEGDKWVDGDTTWFSVTAWGRLAENIRDSFQKGDRVFVRGRCETKPGYTKKNQDGSESEVGPRPVLIAEYAGHELAFAPSTQHRQKRDGSSSAPRQSAPARKAAAPAKDELSFDDNAMSDLDNLEDLF